MKSVTHNAGEHPANFPQIHYEHKQSSRLTKTFFLLLAAALGLTLILNMQQLPGFSTIPNSSQVNNSKEPASPQPSQDNQAAFAPLVAIDTASKIDKPIEVMDHEEIKPDENTSLDSARIMSEKVAVERLAKKKMLAIKADKIFLKDNDSKNLQVMSELPRVTEMQEFHFKKSSFMLDEHTDAAKLDSSIQRYIATPESWSKIIILGFTDNRGSKAINVRLGMKRAEALKKILTDKGIDAERISVASFGPDLPIGSNETPEGRTRNRRVEMNLVGPSVLVANAANAGN
ncbi:MAG: OmpA family protein [Chitinophagaceae bacterium]